MSNSHNQNQSTGEHDGPHFDRIFDGALNEVHVPRGLRQRLYASIRSEAGVESGTVESGTVESGTVESGTVESGTGSTDHDDTFASLQSHSDHVESESSASSAQVARRYPRRIVLVVSAVAASIAFALIGLPYFDKSLDSEQLATHGLAVLDGLPQSDSEWSLDPMPVDGLKTLKWAAIPSVVGVRSNSADPFGQQNVWKLQLSGRNRQQVYVIEFVDPVLVEGISNQLRVIPPRSGAWSLAVVRTKGRILVVATRGNIRDCFRFPQAA